MSPIPASPGGRQLWGLLPEHHRSRDGGDLAAYVDALGEVLDLLRDVIEQRSADTFPDHADLQPWVLPYIADLVDTHLVSADEVRRRAEIANAVFWRKTKGTLRMVEQIALALGGFGWTDGTPAARPREPVRVEEGLRRVAVTPRVPLGAPPALRADRRRLLRDASLPMGTVDFRFYSRRIASADGRESQVNPHGVPCFPGGVEDLAARTPDVRTPGLRRGLAHPSRVLIFAVPHPGFFPPGWELVPRPTESDHAARGGILVGPRQIEQNAHEVFTIEDCIFDGPLRVKAGAVKLVRCAVRSLIVDAAVMVDAQGRPTGKPVLEATDCLFETVESAGLAQLTFCTVLKRFQAPRLFASESILADAFVVPKSAEPWHRNAQGVYDGTPQNALRYSRLPAAALAPELVNRERLPPQRLDFGAYRCTSRPAFFVASEFGVPGSGVLLPASGPELDAGTEDRGELGAYHHRGHAVRARAVLEKLRDHLPVGQMPVVIPDPKLIQPPPTLKRRP
jgi:hypothetical protein